ncbi:hypothetical protein C2845_PM16G18380 [Panicum miliaceum]|uniref:F-box associated domain-containing protein n=1 Tax=Panicum miliaceum TaxID=4540 RepID=A0A3L6Q0W2_PANMI|nr:hypothetical protein C2845_PM16G18380 [Panicum miliaceum]
MRALTGWRHRGTDYVSTCNGIVLLASAGFSAPCRCTLWNPAVADVAREVTVPEPSPDSHLINRTIPGRSGKYRIRLSCGGGGGGPTHRIEYSLVVHSLGDADKQTPPRTVLSAGVDERIKQKSLYMDGTIYLLHLDLEKSATILAFNVDDETVSRLHIPREHQQDGSWRRSLELELIKMSGRPCLVTAGGGCVAMWLLAAADRRWERVSSPIRTTRFSIGSSAFGTAAAC